MTQSHRPLDGKVALISGTAGGQGRAAAMAFADAGARVLGCDVDAEHAQETVELVRRRGGEMQSVHPLDPSDPAQAQSWIDTAISIWGGFDILYNNAGSLRAVGPFAISTQQEWDLTIRNELTIVYVSSHAAWQPLIDRGGGVIINTASASGHVEFHPLRSAAHSAAKAGVIAFTRTLAVEGAPHGIRAVSISPGFTRTPATSIWWDGNEEQRAMGATLTSRVPLGRAGEPEDIVHAAVFLASPAAAYITGTDLLIDGGASGSTFGPLVPAW